MKETKKEEFPIVTIYNIEDWHSWLKKNHLTEKKVGMINYKKHTGKKSISHKEAMHEAICFGWIDTTIKRLDEDRYLRYFVRRGDKANWSKNTLKYGKSLFLSGKMSPHGIMRYKEGLKKKPHDHGIPNNPNMPKELKKALNKNKITRKNFNLLPPSSKKMFYRLILRAKTQETKEKRINDIINNSMKNFNL